MVLERPNALCTGVHVGSDARREAWVSKTSREEGGKGLRGSGVSI